MKYSHLKIGLFIPCYVDQFYPQVGIATLELLEKLGCNVGFPLNQTCCGQPMANSGFEHLTNGCNTLFMNSFGEFDYIVSPSGSCVLHIKDHLKVEGKPTESKEVRKKVYELVEFITDVLKIDFIQADFPHRVGLHQGCHGQRGLHLAQMSELNAEPFSKPETLLRNVKGLELVELDRKDECCGFGGTFCVSEEAVSVKMGKDRVADHIRHDAEYITGSDMSCLMHLEGILRRKNSEVQVKHIAEILNNALPALA
ncbi:(Fe-S)-binding protein [Dyadobacter luteus]|jgi:L-lactate dehydrogenase complex protein LldE|uniref:(Fe-S)-binding protein n=1 Tax=Dyadobacter luteus TaxID=2259619 RepID=A0A3D8YG41_9BACT|nr:(Fe-S)-binding protein [Dyadobacter luteus]REA63247.1 (Fe-S)-binding protein [Dyadobacter luteus]